MAHEKSETVKSIIDNMFYNLDTVDDRHRRINPYDYFPEAELESPNVGVERGLGVLGGPYKTGEEGAEAARKRSMNFRERRIMPNENMQGQDLRGMLADSMLKGYNMPMQPSGQARPMDSRQMLSESMLRGYNMPMRPPAGMNRQARPMDSRQMLAKGMQYMDPRQGLLYRGASAGADKLQQAILALMELIQSGQEDFEKGYKPGMRLR